jgi:hypothetical protein
MDKAINFFTLLAFLTLPLGGLVTAIAGHPIIGAGLGVVWLIYFAALMTLFQP